MTKPGGADLERSPPKGWSFAMLPLQVKIEKEKVYVRASKQVKGWPRLGRRWGGHLGSEKSICKGSLVGGSLVWEQRKRLHGEDEVGLEQQDLASWDDPNSQLPPPYCHT